MAGEGTLLRDLFDLLHLFGDKWVPPILVALAGGPMRRVDIYTRFVRILSGRNGRVNPPSCTIAFWPGR